jgi:hypothetical protein
MDMTVAAAQQGITVRADEDLWSLRKSTSPQVEYRKPG